MQIEAMTPPEYVLVQFLFALAEQGLVDEVAYRDLCRANRLDPADPGTRKGVYAALAEAFLNGDSEGAFTMRHIAELAERGLERAITGA